VSLTINYSPGLLIDGRDSPSSYSTANTPDYYPTLVESAGFERLEDLYGYGLDHSQRLPELRGTDTRRVTLRPFRRTELITRLGELWSLYVNSFHANWFELPIDKGEFQGLITALVLLGPRGYVLVAEAERRFVGFTVAAPELNDTFARVQAASGAAGRTWAALRFARVPRARVLFLGVDPDYRGSGLDGRLIRGIWESCRDAGVQMAEASWILGRNYQMRGALRGLGFRTLKRWRLYSKPV
jgi:GNAT superfamily N-acetyltransferase